MLSFCSFVLAHPLDSGGSLTLVFLARPSGLLGKAGLENLGAGIGICLSASGEGGRDRSGYRLLVCWQPCGGVGGGCWGGRFPTLADKRPSMERDLFVVGMMAPSSWADFTLCDPGESL